MGKSVGWVGVLMLALWGCGGGHLPTSAPNFPSTRPLPLPA